MTEWQLIETAPMDGTQVLLYCPDNIPFDAFIVGGWYDVEDCKWIEAACGSYPDAEPTHWMPLPRRPQVEE
jgi:hypothetical protein